MAEALSEEQIEHLLKHQILGHIGCHADDITYIVPICYAYDDNCIYGRTHNGMKLKMMTENPKVCFQVEYIENMLKWESVICWGKFEELTDIGKRDKAIQILKNRISVSVDNAGLHKSPYWPFSLSDLDNVEGVLFCIQLNKKTGRLSSYHNPISTGYSL
jgi:nitroimidazol reductase NimA-like FMN-containing flavoprotein (pyridoxamine 5'-phosphate oxidase superfamily)